MREPLIGDGGKPMPRAAHRPSAEDELIERRAARFQRVAELAARRQEIISAAGRALGELHRLAKESDDCDAKGGGRVWVRTSRNGARLDGAIDYIAIGVATDRGDSVARGSTQCLLISAHMDNTVKDGWSLVIDEERVSPAVAREAIASVLLAIEDWTSERDQIPF